MSTSRSSDCLFYLFLACPSDPLLTGTLPILLYSLQSIPSSPHILLLLSAKQDLGASLTDEPTNNSFEWTSSFPSVVQTNGLFNQLGSTCEFLVDTKNSLGWLMVDVEDTSGHSIPVAIDLLSPSDASLPPMVKSEAYKIRFTPTRLGYYRATLRWNGQDLQGSPFTCCTVDASQVGERGSSFVAFSHAYSHLVPQKTACGIGESNPLQLVHCTSEQRNLGVELLWGLRLSM
ncbi:unnamed protein product [Protopolystoma xenopodis]|uniref:Uncharacterized protein n=1 Tax=Protopolystoma xenopodis TaxID=117903 RepID=A0A3S4ZKZ2_9PLAT|nr:unnamed protein product [Protopolystoma xenopodis]